MKTTLIDFSVLPAPSVFFYLFFFLGSCLLFGFFVVVYFYCVNELNGFIVLSVIQVYVATPLNVCESRDRKGLYAKARKGLIKGFTGIDDPYEPPTHPDITIDTTNSTVREEVETIVQYLANQKYLKLS